MKVTVIGAGYVGLVTAACLAEMGNSVMCLDVDTDRVLRLRAGELPIHEPGLETYVTRNAGARRLLFSSDAAEAIAHGTIIFIAVGTPAAEDGSADLGHVLSAARSIGRHMTDFKLIVDKSTVPVGTAPRVRAAVIEELAARSAAIPFNVVSNPEFLKEGAAVNDFMYPDRVVLGCDDERAELLMRALYAPFLRNRDRVLVMDVASAELTKYAANAMLASRISFMNELSSLAERAGADIEQVRRGIGSDSRIGTHFLYAGIGWGGSCFPKDVRALVQMGREHGVDMPLVSAAAEVNRRQHRVLVERIHARFGDDLRGLRFGVWGLAFKPGTDDMREAPSIGIIGALLDAGAEVRAYDPVARAHALSHWNSATGFEQVDDAMTAARQAHALLVLTEWREFRSPDFAELRHAMALPVVLDGRNLYDSAFVSHHGFEYAGIGRPGSLGRAAALNASPLRPPAPEPLPSAA